MRYISTRGQAPAVSFLDAVLAGMAPDGGLYVPESWPALTDGLVAGRETPPHIASGYVAHSGYGFAAGAAMASLSGGAFNENQAWDLAADVYHNEKCWPPAVTPLVQIGSGAWLLELFHGPSLSFKDVAMQLIAPLYDRALQERGEKLTVLCATSGDTGGAAVEALKRRKHLDLVVLLPKGRVSEVQRRFMTTSEADNIHPIEIDGDFDACQAIVKAMFADRDFATRARLSAVNSINWARILAQSVYYHVAAQILCGQGPVSFSVPTGNFGDAYSGFVAKRMGAPIGAINIATNANDILNRALETGEYARAGMSVATLSPAMDIQVASNFERILFEALDRDGEHVKRLFGDFAVSGRFEIPATARRFLREHFTSWTIDDEETLSSMKHAFEHQGQFVCPHTAIGLAAAAKQLDEDYPQQLGLPIVHLATAHPAKFPETVERATGVRPELPAKCADLFQRSEKFDSLPADAEAVKQYIRERSRAWS
ncbi:MAG: threonine synthase [Alphaproteobacteria bacterium]|nr:threonine synthase [Alphaproteobacteria bacterium]